MAAVLGSCSLCATTDIPHARGNSNIKLIKLDKDDSPNVYIAMLLQDYLKKKSIPVAQAAQEIKCSREWIYKHFKGYPLGYRTALKVQKWTRGAVKVSESMHL